VLDYILLYYLISRIFPAIFVFPKPLFPIFRCPSLRLCNIYHNLLYPSLSMTFPEQVNFSFKFRTPLFPNNTLFYLQTIFLSDSCVLTPSLTVRENNVLATVHSATVYTHPTHFLYLRLQSTEDRKGRAKTTRKNLPNAEGFPTLTI
jgi:hypothetical protein